MTPSEFCEIALSLPETSQTEDETRPDFQVRGKVFASLFPADGWGVIKLTAEVQTELVAEAPQEFEACNGAWGRSGATTVILKDAQNDQVLRALMSAWRKNAPRSLADELHEPE